MGWCEPADVEVAVNFFKAMGLGALPGISNQKVLEEKELSEVAQIMHEYKVLDQFVQSVVVANRPFEGSQVKKVKLEILDEFQGSVFKDKHDGEPQCEHLSVRRPLRCDQGSPLASSDLFNSRATERRPGKS